jgi:uncharacterized membrane protein YcjF (UPF0283 family)
MSDDKPDDNTLTDRSYELVESIEKRKKLLTTIVIICFVLVPVGIGIDASIYMVATHQKGGWSDISMAMIAIVSAFSGLLLIVGIKKYIVMKDLRKKLDQIELFEETVYKEVLSSNLHLLDK